MAIPALQAFVGAVGPTTQQDGNTPPVRLGRTAEVINGALHGRYYESTYRKQMYSGSIIGVISTVGTATTYTGLVLSNPVASSVNLAVNKCGYASLVQWPASAALGLMTGFSSTAMINTSSVTTRCQFFNGSNSGQGLLGSNSTLPVTPTVNQLFATGMGAGPITTLPYVPQTFVDLEGSLILPPGAFCAFYTSTVSNTAAQSYSFCWEEILA